MKILYANPIFLDYRIPLFKRLNELFAGDFHVLYSPKRYELRYPKVLEKMKLEIPTILLEFKGDYLFNTKTRSFTKHSYEGRSIPFCIGMVNILSRLNPEIIITEGFLGWTPYVLLYCLLFRKKMYIHYERTCHTERNTPKLFTLQRKLFDKFTAGYLVNGSETKKYLLSIGVDTEKISVAGMSADTRLQDMVKTLSDADKASIRSKYAVNSHGLTFLYVGRISRAKGADRLIEAWKEHTNTYPNDTLILAGDGELLDQYIGKDLAGLKVLGRVNYDDIYELYAIADIFIIATLQDNWSLVVPEAMSCGIPVASSIYNGCNADLIEEGVVGFAFNPLNHEEIVQTLQKFHNSDLKSMGQNAIKHETQFNIENSALRIYNVLK